MILRYLRGRKDRLSEDPEIGIARMRFQPVNAVFLLVKKNCDHPRFSLKRIDKTSLNSGCFYQVQLGRPGF